MQTSLLMISVVLLVVSLKDAAGLKCEVGVNNETQILECEGSWEKVKMMLQEKMGSKWEMVQQNMTSGITNLIESMKGQVENIKESLGRRRREAGEEASAEPEPEPESDSGYYCIKNSMTGATLKSCLPKSVAEPLSMACGALPGTGTVCVCNDQDVCNSAGPLRSLALIVFLSICTITLSWV